MAVSGDAFAQRRDESLSRGLLDEIRVGVLGHHVEPAGTENGTDLNFEILFSRPAISYGSHMADFMLKPRLHLGASINVDGNTSQAYAGFTWDIPLLERLSLELTLGGSWHDGPSEAPAAHSVAR